MVKLTGLNNTANKEASLPGANTRLIKTLPDVEKEAITH